MRQWLFKILFPDYWNTLVETIEENYDLKSQIDNPPILIYYQSKPAATSFPNSWTN